MSGVFNNSQLWIDNQLINEFALIEFSTSEFHHAWCALKSSQTIALWDSWMAVRHLSIVHWSLSICCDFSLYMLSNSILEISFAEILSICKSESFDKSDLNVHIKSDLALDTNAIVLARSDV